MARRGGADPRWDAAIRQHRVALDEYVAVARAVDADSWARPRAGGAWSAAEITDHVTLAYEALLRELGGEVGMKPRLTRVHRAVLRWLLLPHILFHRSFPVRARSPREIRPSAGREREEAIALLLARGEEFERRARDARASGPARLSHPYFGSVPLVKGVRFCAVHLDHHRRQVESVAGSGASR